MSAGTTTLGARPAEWLAGARPRTLFVAVVPVVVGGGVSIAGGSIIWWRTVLALVVSLAMQVGTNYANDYSDGVRGTDTVRVGPVRLVAGGLAPPSAVRRAAFLSFGLAAAAGLVLALVTSPYLIAIGAACVAAGWFYTGGPRPYGYAGYGEIFVFVFFGLVAVVGTAYVSLGRVTLLAVVAAVPVGLLAVCLLVVNNLRDLDNDAKAGKHTLAVRFGDGPTRLMYEALLGATVLAIAGTALLRPFALIALVGAVLALRALAKVHRGATGHELVDVLAMTSRVGLVVGVLLALGVAL